MAYPDVQVQEPLFFNLQVFTKVVPAPISVLSGTLTSETNCPRSQGIGMGVAIGGIGVLVGRGVFVGGGGVLVGRTTTGEVGVATMTSDVGVGLTVQLPSDTLAR